MVMSLLEHSNAMQQLADFFSEKVTNSRPCRLLATPHGKVCNGIFAWGSVLCAREEMDRESLNTLAKLLLNTSFFRLELTKFACHDAGDARSEGAHRQTGVSVPNQAAKA